MAWRVVDDAMPQLYNPRREHTAVCLQLLETASVGGHTQHQVSTHEQARGNALLAPLCVTTTNQQELHTQHYVTPRHRRTPHAHTPNLMHAFPARVAHE